MPALQRARLPPAVPQPVLIPGRAINFSYYWDYSIIFNSNTQKERLQFKAGAEADYCCCSMLRVKEKDGKLLTIVILRFSQCGVKDEKKGLQETL
jgi:hypothetical protein